MLRASKLFESTFLIMGYMAKIDGPVQTAEIRACEAAIARFSVDAHIQREAMDLFREGKEFDFDPEPVLARFELELAPYEDLKRSFIAIQLKVALADGPLHPAEKAFLLELCRRFRIHPQYFSMLGKGSEYTHRHAPDPLSEAYRVLGLSSTASDADIKQHYRRLMNQHHPDKILARGLPQSYLRAAQEKTQAIRAAYDEIRTQRALG